MSDPSAVLENWQKLSVWERLPYFKKLRRLVKDRADEIVATIVADMKKPAFEALLAETVLVYRLIDFYIKAAPEVLKPKRFKSWFWINKKIEVRREPLGNVLVVSPFNYPFSLPMSTIVPALMAGNKVFFRPSSDSKQTGFLIKRLFNDAGFPTPLLEVMVGGHEAVKEMAENPYIDKLCFTGSVETGKRLYDRSAAVRFIPPTMELGGSNVAVVLADADLEQAAKTIIWARCSNAGQSCNAIKRVVADESVFDRLEEILRKECQKLRPGIDVGPVVSARQREVLRQQYDSAMREGAQVVYQGPGADEIDNYFPPTVLEVEPLMGIWHEEVFGPMLLVTAVRSEEEAVRLINESRFDLGTSIFTSDKRKFQALASEIRSGSVHHNDAMTEAAIMGAPFGSATCGIGFGHDEEILRELTRPKVVITERFKGKPFWQFPYTEEKYNFWRKWIFWVVKWVK